MSEGKRPSPELSPTRLIEELLGFRDEPTRRVDVEAAINERLKRRGQRDLKAYTSLLQDQTARAVEARALADRLTVNETYFFREAQHLEVLTKTLVPERVARGELPIRVLSLGCSSGEEPYGIALSLLENGVSRRDMQIVACDASPAVIESAERGEYSAWSLRNATEAIRARYFRRNGSRFVLDDEIRSLVRFEVRNVLDPDPLFWDRPRFDVVFCRNMLIYLTPDVIRAVMDRIATVLRPGGLLMLGHSETAHAGKRFAVMSSHGAFYFRRREDEDRSPAQHEAQQPSPSRASDVEGWAEAIERSADRVRGLGTQKGEGREAVERASSVDPFETALALFREDRFKEALDCLPLASASSDQAILRATILMNLGRLREAEQACDEALGLDGRAAFAYYLLGLCNENRGENERARGHYDRAAALDDSFAMPRLRSGMLARRAGERSVARLLLREALHAFSRQSERAYVLFAGNIARDSLSVLCAAEIAACEGER